MIDDDAEREHTATPVAVSVIESQERANIDMLVATAKRYPRDLERVQKRMEKMATMDLETAESCTYHLERDGHAIEGPSVRMAEIAVSCYQNIRFGVHVVSNDGKVVIAQGFCHDTENNTFGMWETQRRITDKKGRTYSEDMQITTANAAAAIAFRNAVFKVIPGALVKSVEDAARKYAVGDLKTLASRRTRLLRRFAALGVNEARILAFLGYETAEQITVDDVERLIAIGTAIREETTTIEEAFGPQPPEKPNIPQKKSDTPLTDSLRQSIAETERKRLAAEKAADEKTDDLDMSPPPPTQTQQKPNVILTEGLTPQGFVGPETRTTVGTISVTPPKPVSVPVQTTTTLVPEDKPKTMHDEMIERIASEGVTQKEFLSVVAAYGFSRDRKDVLHSDEEVDAGTFSLADLGEKYLRIARTNFRNIIEGIEKMRRGEEP